MSVTVTTSSSRGPAGWAAIGVLGGASLVGLAWVISSRMPSAATAQTGPAAASTNAATPQPAPPPSVVIVQLPPAPQSVPSDAPSSAGPQALAAVHVQSGQPAANPADRAPEPVPEAPAGIRRININTASVEELDLLPGVGKATALAIVEHRTKHGHFRTVSDLDKVPGIGPSRIEKLRPLVIVE